VNRIETDRGIARRGEHLAVAVLCAGLLALAAGCEDDESFHVGGKPIHPHDGQVVSLLPEGQTNHLLPLYVGIDPAGHRLYTSCNALPTVAEIDLWTRSLTKVHDLGVARPGHAKVYPDGAGAVWFAWAGEPGEPTVMRLDPLTGEVTHHDTGLVAANHGAGLREGGAVFAGHRGGVAPDHTVIQVLGDGGKVRTETILPVEVLALRQASDGALVALVRDNAESRGGVYRMRPTDLALISQCLDPDGSPFDGGFAILAELPDGNFVASQDDALHHIPCDGRAWTSLQLEPGQRDLFVVGDEIVLLGNSGTDETQGPNWGIARRYDHDLQPVEPWFPTGKNSRYGRIDRDDNLIWLNSEGTTEVWAVDPADGAVADKVRLGEHVESVTVGPDGRVFYTGRLSNAFGLVDLDAEEAEVIREQVVWPTAPVWQGHTLWLLDQLSSDLVEIDAGSLGVRRVHDLGLDENTLLTFSDVAYHAPRGTLFVAHSEANVLVEYDPQQRVPVGRWQLDGPPVSSDDLTGRLEVLIFDDAVVTFRNSDGVFNRVDPDLDEVVVWNQLHADDVDALRADKRIDQSLRTANGRLIYAGGFAVDAETLDRRPGHDLDVTTLVADLRQGHFLGWRSADRALVVIDADGVVRAEQVLPVSPGSEPALEYVHGDEPQLVFTDFARAEIGRMPLRKLRIEAGLPPSPTP